MPATDYIHGMSIYEHFRNLLAIPSPSWKEDGVSAYIIMKMTENGYFFRDDKAGNLLFWRNPTGEKVMLSAHMDTVDKAVEAHVLEDDGSFFTDGLTALGADDKAAIAALLSTAEKKPDALFLFTRAEELGLRGAAALEREFFDPFAIKAAFILDATGPVGSAIISAPGKNRIDITMEGRSAHAGFQPENGINAIKAAAAAVTRSPSGRIDDETTCNIGMFSAPGSTNIVPDRASYSYEVRSLSDEKRRAVSESIIKAAEEAAAEYGAGCKAELIDLYAPYRIDPDDEALLVAERAVISIGREWSTRKTAGGSDSNCIRALGIDALTLSAGYENAHSVNERILKSEIDALESLASALL